MLAVKEGPLRQQASVQQPTYSDRVAGSTAARPQQRAFISDRLSLFVCIIICAAALWVLAGKSGQIDSTNQRIYTLQTQIQKLSAENASLTAQVDALTRPSRILNYALNQLHMQQATPIQISAGSASNGH